MSVERNKAIARRVFEEAFNRGDLRVIDETVVTPLESVWLVHEGHSASAEPEATFALIQAKGPGISVPGPFLVRRCSAVELARNDMDRGNAETAAKKKPKPARNSLPWLPRVQTMNVHTASPR